MTARTICKGFGKSTYKVSKIPPKKQDRRKEMPKRMLITSDLIRKIRVPYERDPQTVVIDEEKFKNITGSAKVLSKQELEEAKLRREQENDRLAAEALARRQALEAADIVRESKEAEAVDDLKEEARQRARNIVDRAKIAELEADEDIKQMNQMIMQAKVYAVRDAQVEEKKVIMKEMTEEERRLDHMMEQERQRDLAEQQRREEERRLIREKQKAVIIDQIMENEEHRILRAEKKNQEAEAIRKKIRKMQLEDLQADEAKKKAQHEMHESLRIANEAMEQKRKQQKDFAKLEEDQIREYQRKKAEQEAKYEEEQAALKKAKELEIAKMRALQQREQDRMAGEHERRARRDRERMEREWRRKELEEARLKAEREADLKQARRTQVEQRERQVAVEAQRERAEFYRILEAQKEAEALSHAENALRKERNEKHLMQLKKQMCAMEQKRVADRRHVFEEGLHTRILEAQKQQELMEHKKRKLEELRKYKVPEKYLNDVARRAHIPVSSEPQASNA